jgi:hypothetical protein
MAGVGSFKDAFNNGKIEIYTGAQPATPETAVSGTLLCTITAASAARTAETLASGTMTLDSGGSGSVNTLTVNSVEVMGAAVPFNTTLTQTAADVAAQINIWHSVPEYTATSSGAVITIKALPGTGTGSNGYAVAGTFTTIAGTPANLSGGVAALNGLKFGAPGSATIAKLASQSWTGVNGASGTAGWYRAYGSVADAGSTDSTNTSMREDGSIATSGAELNMSTTFTNGATTTISTWSRTLPTA